jgi:hypothetical protein
MVTCGPFLPPYPDGNSAWNVRDRWMGGQSCGVDAAEVGKVMLLVSGTELPSAGL